MKLTAEFILHAVKLMTDKGEELPAACAQFSREQLNGAMWDDGPMTENQKDLLDVLAQAGMDEAQERDLGDALELWLAGWTHEPVSPTSRIMSWYWRAPAKGKRPKGRLYLSTHQAVNALHRSTAKPDESKTP